MDLLVLFCVNCARFDPDVKRICGMQIPRLPRSAKPQEMKETPDFKTAIIVVDDAM